MLGKIFIDYLKKTVYNGPNGARTDERCLEKRSLEPLDGDVLPLREPAGTHGGNHAAPLQEPLLCTHWEEVGWLVGDGGMGQVGGRWASAISLRTGVFFLFIVRKTGAWV